MTEIQKRRKPTFARPNYGRTSRGRIRSAWRRPRGIDNKQRIGKKYMPRKPVIGFGQNAAIRGMHPTGKREVLITHEKMLEAVAPGAMHVRIAAGIGKRLKKKLMEMARAKNLRVLNPQL